LELSLGVAERIKEAFHPFKAWSDAMPL